MLRNTFLIIRREAAKILDNYVKTHADMKLRIYYSALPLTWESELSE